MTALSFVHARRARRGRGLRRLSAIILSAIAVLGAAAPPSRAATPAVRPVVVTLGFDDGWASAYAAKAMLSARGMNATFFAISGKVGTARYMTVAQLHALQDAGNEIGGHTISHARLADLTPEQARYEICNDRAALIGAGLHVTDLAYPYGSFNAQTEQAAASCGYNSARADGGVSCATGCVPAETIPAADRYATRSFPTTSSTTVTRMQNVVDAAKPAGGWVQLVMHQLCSPTDSRCGPASIRPQTLGTLLDWLAAERAAGRVQVKTAAQGIGGAPAAAACTRSVTCAETTFRDPGVRYGPEGPLRRPIAPAARRGPRHERAPNPRS